LYEEIERRRYPRSAYIRTLEYTRRLRAAGEVFLCMSVDISDSGICVYAADPIDKGEDVEFADFLRGYSKDFYRVGLEFRNNF
jgi:hypothetical protein